MKKLRKHPQAEHDIADAATRYARESIDASDRFLRETEFVFARIRNMPGSGSLRFSRELDLSELRMIPLAGFPYLLFYLERKEHIDLIRVLHSHRDTFGILLGLE